MPTTTPSPAELLVVSDIHIRQPHDQRAVALLSLIEALKTNPPRYFVLLGDIFDFYFGRQRFFVERFRAIFEALEALAERGSSVLFCEGNHEFGMIPGSLGRIRLIQDSRFHLDLGTHPTYRRVVLTHGDLLNADFAYRVFRRVIKSPLTQQVAAKIVPARALNRYALTHSKVSRHLEKPAPHKQILSAAEELRRSSQADLCIFGHFHQAYTEPNATRPNLLCMPCWPEYPNALALNSQGQERWRLCEGSWQSAPA